MSNSIAGKTFALFDNPINKKIIAEIESAGAKIFKFPVIEAEKMEPDKTSVEILKNLKKYDWVIFPDVLTVDFFLESLAENGVDFFEMDELRVCALGECVSDRLRFGQLHADVIPRKIAAKNVLSALKDYAGENELGNLEFLLIKENSLTGEIKNQLLAANAKFSELPIYRIKIGGKNEIAKLKTLLKGGAIDEFIFSAPTDFIALEYIFNEEPLARIFSEIKISAVDALTRQIIREHDIKPAGLFRLGKIDTV